MYDDKISFINQHGDKAAGLLDYYNGDLNKAQAALAYCCGHFHSGNAFAKDLCDRCYDLPDWLRDCVDYTAAWAKLKARFYFATPAKRGGVYVFFK